ncbi:hypothetical protein EES38_22205, partial [Vibrio viridaestus]
MSKKRKKKIHAVKPCKKAAQRVYFNRIKQLSQMLGCDDALRILTKQEVAKIYSQRMHFTKPKVKAGYQISRKKMRFYTHFCQLFCRQEEYVFV